MTRDLSVSDVYWATTEVAHQGDLGVFTVAGMCEALLHARMRHPRPITPEFLKELAWAVKAQNGFRKVNLEFPADALTWANIDVAINSLCTSGDRLTPLEWVYEFLLIHPFIDGNGRVAAICLNYLTNTLDSDRLRPLPPYDLIKKAAKVR